MPENYLFKNLCVWVKGNAGMGSFYRSAYQQTWNLNLQHEIESLHRRQTELEDAELEVMEQREEVQTRLAELDPLTRVSNRGSFDAEIERWVERHKQNGKAFVVAMLDLDNFKQINDTHGHQIGDRILLSAAQRFGKHVRSSDFLARYGGEEFVIMMSDLDLVQAETKFVEIIARIAGCSHEYTKDGQDFKVNLTASCGLAEFNPGSMWRGGNPAPAPNIEAATYKKAILVANRYGWRVSPHTLFPYESLRTTELSSRVEAIGAETAILTIHLRTSTSM